MRWLIFFIFAYLMLGAQIGIGSRLAIGGASPNLVLLAVIFICINTPREVALSAGMILGLMQDLLTSAPPGLYAVSYGLVAALCASANRQVYPDHPLTHFFFTFVAQIITSAVLLVHDRFYRSIHVVDGAVLTAMPLIFASFYSALVAPLVLGVLSRIKPIFGFLGVSKRVRPY